MCISNLFIHETGISRSRKKSQERTGRPGTVTLFEFSFFNSQISMFTYSYFEPKNTNTIPKPRNAQPHLLLEYMFRGLMVCLFVSLFVCLFFVSRVE